MTTFHVRRRWLAIAFTGLTGLFAGCATLNQVVKTPELAISNAHITSMSLADMQLAFDVDVKNPNPIGLHMQGLSYSLQVQDKSVVQGALKEKLAIGANQASRVRLPFTLRYEEVLGTLLALRDQHALRYRISGEADFGLIKLPYSKEGTFALPKLPTVGVHSVRVNRFDLAGVDLALVLQVGNDNGFPIRLDGLDYQLKLGDAPLFKGSATSPLAVRANEQGQLKLDLRLDYAQIGALLQTLRSANQLPVELSSRIKLPAAGGKTELPLAWKGNVPLFK